MTRKRHHRQAVLRLARLRADGARGWSWPHHARRELFSSLLNSRTAEIARFAVIWFTASALIVQTILTLGSTPVQAGTAGLSVICHSAGAQGPADSHDAVSAGHLKCIACVIAQSLAPPARMEPGLLPRVVATVAYAQSGATRSSHRTFQHAHAPRGPPATA